MFYLINLAKRAGYWLAHSLKRTLGIAKCYAKTFYSLFKTKRKRSFARSNKKTDQQSEGKSMESHNYAGKYYGQGKSVR